MTLKTDSTGQIQPRNGNGNGGEKGTGLVGLLTTLGPEIARALPRHLTPDRMARVALTALRTTPKLMQCTAASFAASIMTLAQLGLEPNTPLGLAYLIPRNNRKKNCVECTVIIGYQGFLDMARRSGLVAGVYAFAVREGDRFSYSLGLDPTIEHVPADTADRETKKITHVYAVARLKGGEPVFVVLTHAQIQARRTRSAAGDDGPWKTDYEAMCLKTAIRALWRWLPKSAEMAKAEEIERVVDLGATPAAVLEEQQTRALAAAGVFVDEPMPHDPETGEVPADKEPTDAELAGGATGGGS